MTTFSAKRSATPLETDFGSPDDSGRARSRSKDTIGLGPRLRSYASGMLNARSGPLSSDLVREPAAFGLGALPVQRMPDRVASTVCGFCSTGCSLAVHSKDGAAINITPNTGYPVNHGMACPKGWEALAALKADDRATVPYLRGGDGVLAPTDWDTALDVFCERMQAIQREHGPDSVAFLSTGQIPTEEMALLGAVAKFGMGFRHGDGNTRQCMATSVVAYKQAFGFDAPPYTYADFEESDVIVLVGANPCIAHPILWQRICRNRRDADVVVIDPRRTETAAAASSHYAIAPNSDLVLFYGLAREVIRRGYTDRAFVDAHTEGFDAYAAHVEGFSPQEVALTCGISPARFDALVETIGSGRRVSFWWTMGVNQGHQAVRTAQAIINLALLTGNIGRPGTGANSITGQTNAMGSRLFSNTTSLFAGRDFLDASHRQEVADLLGIDAGSIPDQNSLAYDQIIDGVREGRIKGLWIIATNPGHSWIDRSGFDEEVLDKLDFLVVQDMYATTETACRADLILPAAGAGEKDGTVINSERRIGRYRKVSRAPGQALADFWIFKLLANRWGCGEMFAEWESPAAVFQILKRLSRGRPCDFTGIEDYETLDREGGVQWPHPEGSAAPCPERRLFEDGVFYHPNGRARFCFEAPKPPKETVDSDYPFTLLTGRGSSAQWHTNTRTGKSAVLRKLYPRELYLEISPQDANNVGVVDGARAWVSSRRGRILARAFVTGTMRPGDVFLPMHYAETNCLTAAEFDPYSRQPAYKSCAVRVEAASQLSTSRSRSARIGPKGARTLALTPEETS